MPFLESIQNLYWIFSSSLSAPTFLLPSTVLPSFFTLYLFLCLSVPHSTPASLAGLKVSVGLNMKLTQTAARQRGSVTWEAERKGIWDNDVLAMTSVVYLMFCPSDANLPWTLTWDSVREVLYLQNGIQQISSRFFFPLSMWKQL